MDDGHDIDDLPVELHEELRAQAGEGWSSKQSPAAEPPKAAAAEYSEQSKQVIRALHEGMADPDCSQLDGYGPARFSAQFKGQQRLMEGLAFGSEEEYVRWLKQVVDEAGAVTSWRRIQEARMGVLNLRNGSRMTIFLPPIAKGGKPTFSLRKHVARNFSHMDFVDRGVLSPAMMEFLRSCVAGHVNILFVGPMGSGKTTLLRALAEMFADNEKIAVIEQIPELHIEKPLVVERVYQPNVEGMGLAEVLDFELYDGLQRLVVGEVHLSGLTKMLETFITVEGSMSTYHAFSTEQAGERMKLALQIENSNVTAQTAISYMKQAIELVVVMENLDGVRRVTQVTEIDWRSSGGREVFGGTDLFKYDHARKMHLPTGNQPDPNGNICFKFEHKYNIPLHRRWFINHEQVSALQQASADAARYGR